MPRQIFDNDETLLDYGHMDDELGLLGMGDRGYADVYPPDGANILFHDQFERRAREMQRSPNDMKAVHIIPQRTGPWSGRNNLGNEVEFAPDNNNQQTVLKLDEWDFPQVWTVSLFHNLPPNPVTPYAIKAVINAGVGGSTQTFEVDWNQGTTFSTVFNALNVIAKYENQSAVPPSGMRLGVQIGKRPLSGTRPYWTSAFLEDFDVVPGPIVTIPPFATRMFVLQRTANCFAATCTYFFSSVIGAAGAIRGTVTGSDLLTNFGGWYPIPGGANFVQIFDTAASAAEGRLLFELGL